MVVGAKSIPQWLEILLEEKFFDPCILHESAKKNEKNIFCLNCCITICPHCLPFHRSHRRLQIRRYVYHDVIRLSDAQKWINCCLVQPYTTNSAKVVFLNKRPISRLFRGSGNVCIKCDRSLQDPFLYCSLSCKVNHLETTSCEGKIVDSNSQLLPLLCKTRTHDHGSFRQLEEHPQITPNSVLDSPVSPAATWSGGSSTNTTATTSNANCKSSSLVCTATTEFLKKNKKKRSSLLTPRVSCRSKCSPATVSESIRRRKGVPQRSPLN